MRRAVLLAALLAPTLAFLGGCGSNDTDPGPGGVTVGEAKALDEAAEMIDSRRPPPEALKEGAPESAAPAPSPSASE
jgi:hypothetical protein